MHGFEALQGGGADGQIFAIKAFDQKIGILAQAVQLLEAGELHIGDEGLDSRLLLGGQDSAVELLDDGQGIGSHILQHE